MKETSSTELDPNLPLTQKERIFPQIGSFVTSLVWIPILRIVSHDLVKHRSTSEVLNLSIQLSGIMIL